MKIQFNNCQQITLHHVLLKAIKNFEFYVILIVHVG